MLTKLLLVLLLLPSCAHGPCWAKHPLDGKAVSWCKAEARAEEFCGDTYDVVYYDVFRAVVCRHKESKRLSLPPSEEDVLILIKQKYDADRIEAERAAKVD